jgi:hypothetical protein
MDAAWDASGPRHHIAEPSCLIGLARSDRLALGLPKAITAYPEVAGRRDSCLRFDPASVKYIDLPETPELRSGHLNRSNLELSRDTEIPPQIQDPSSRLFGIYPAAHIRFRMPPASFLLECGLLSPFSSLPKRSSELRQSFGSGPHPPELETLPAEASLTSVFYVVWKKHFRFLRFLESPNSNV